MLEIHHQGGVLIALPPDPVFLISFVKTAKKTTVELILSKNANFHAKEYTAESMLNGCSAVVFR